MPRESKITHEQVAAAADGLTAEGSNPTIRLVRERLGNVGSNGTIHRLLQDWKAAHERHIVATVSLPPALQKTILDFMEQEVSRAKADLQNELTESQQAASDLATENERQNAEIEALTNSIERFHADVANLRGKTAQLETDLENTRNEVVRERDAAEAARTELAKAILRLEAMPRLESDLADTRALLREKDTQREDAARQLAVGQSEIESLKNQLNTEKQHGADLLTRLEADKRRLESQLDEAVSSARAAAAHAAALQAEHNMYTKEQDQLKSQLDQAVKEVRSATTDTARFRGENDLLSRENSRLVAENQRLSQT